MKVVICGSMTFFPQMRAFAEDLGQDGHEIFLPNTPDEYPDGCPEKDKNPNACITCKRRFEEKEAHIKKIEECDCVVMFNPNGHIGNDSFGELCVADYLKKPIFYSHGVMEGQLEDVDRLTYVGAKRMKWEYQCPKCKAIDTCRALVDSSPLEVICRDCNHVDLHDNVIRRSIP